jgi:hypothetical protein
VVFLWLAVVFAPSENRLQPIFAKPIMGSLTGALARLRTLLDPSGVRRFAPHESRDDSRQPHSHPNCFYFQE